jgi:hypothetical protein
MAGRSTKGKLRRCMTATESAGTADLNAKEQPAHWRRVEEDTNVDPLANEIKMDSRFCSR